MSRSALHVQDDDLLRELSRVGNDLEHAGHGKDHGADRNQNSVSQGAVEYPHVAAASTFDPRRCREVFRHSKGIDDFGHDTYSPAARASEQLSTLLGIVPQQFDEQKNPGEFETIPTQFRLGNAPYRAFEFRQRRSNHAACALPVIDIGRMARRK